MELTTRIFRDLAVLAHWAFQVAECEPGAYKLAEVAKNKKGAFNINRDALQTSSLPECATWQDESEYIVQLSYNGGMQVYTFAIGNVFDLLAKFKKIATEDITAKEKSELCTMTKGDKGEILSNNLRVKVLQYKSDGNTLTEKWESLTSYADGIYYYVDKGTINGDIANFVFAKNGIYWDAMRCDRVEWIEARRGILIADLRNFEENVISRAERGMFINTLHIEVMRRLGYDTAPLYESRNAYIKRREDEEKRKREEKQRREQERKGAEERRNAELLADGKKKLLNGEKITVEQIELIAEVVGYKINIRTLGTMRKKLVSMSYSETDGWNYSYYQGKNTSEKSFTGAMDAIKSIYMMLKSEECERESAQETECTAETPQSEQSEQTAVIIPVTINQYTYTHIAKTTFAAMPHPALSPALYTAKVYGVLCGHIAVRRRRWRRKRRCMARYPVPGGILVRNVVQSPSERKETGVSRVYLPRQAINSHASQHNGINTPLHTLHTLHTGITLVCVGTNENISNIINKQYHGEMFCRGA